MLGFNTILDVSLELIANKSRVGEQSQDVGREKKTCWDLICLNKLPLSVALWSHCSQAN